MTVSAKKEKEILQSLTDSQLYRRCQEYGLNAKLWLRKFAGLLPEVSRRQLYKKRGFVSIYEFAAKLAGMNQFTVDRVLNLSTRLCDKPVLRKLFEDGKEGWSKLDKVSYIATKETDAFWAKKAATLSMHTLTAYIQEFRNKNAPQTVLENDGQNISVTSQAYRTFSFPVSPELEKKLWKLKQETEKEQKKTLSWNEALLSVIKKIEAKEGKTGDSLIRKQAEVKLCPDCVKKRCNEAEEHQKVGRHIPKEVRQIIIIRSEGMCEFENCLKPGEIFHHVRRFALRKNHDPQFIRYLCKKHEGLLQASLIKNEEEEPEVWRLQDEPDRNDIKFLIDERVAEYRQEP